VSGVRQHSRKAVGNALYYSEDRSLWPHATCLSQQLRRGRECYIACEGPLWPWGIEDQHPPLCSAACTTNGTEVHPSAVRQYMTMDVSRSASCSVSSASLTPPSYPACAVALTQHRNACAHEGRGGLAGFGRRQATVGPGASRLHGSHFPHQLIAEDALDGTAAAQSAGRGYEDPSPMHASQCDGRRC
jgi:hypothetical protein